MFQPPRDRDAYATIRGYVFQIHRTIDRWLTLDGTQALELERGEDIDVVAQLIASGPRSDTDYRLLEQIKHRDASITLRTPSAVEAIVNFWDHRRANPEANLRFRYLCDSAHWAKLAIEEARRVGAAFVYANACRDSVVELLASGAFEDAIEAGIIAGRGMMVHRALAPLTREMSDGIGIDLDAEFLNLSEDDRCHADRFSIIAAIIPAALCVARISITDRSTADSACRRVAAVCRQVAEDHLATTDLWRSTAELFELSSAEAANARPLLRQFDVIHGGDEGAAALKTLALVLATCRAGPSEVIHCQLASMNWLLRWFPAHETVYRFITLPYVESYWRKAIAESRFLFRSPAVTCPAIETALAAAEAIRVRAVLVAAADGFQISRTLRSAIADLRQPLAPG